MNEIDMTDPAVVKKTLERIREEFCNRDTNISSDREWAAKEVTDNIDEIKESLWAMSMFMETILVRLTALESKVKA